MTQTIQTTTIFANIFAAIKADKEKEFTKFVAGINEVTETEKILQPYSYYSNLMTTTKRKQSWELADLKIYVIERKRKEDEKYLAKKLAHLQAIENAPDLLSITFNIEWKKSRMWGSNPRCEAKVETSDKYEYFDSGSIGGCGYDKESTAIANAANQSNSFLKALCLVKEQNISTGNRELFGYGSGYGIIPQLEGGVGVSCYPKIFEAIGFTWKNVGSGKSFDVYVATKKA